MKRTTKIPMIMQIPAKSIPANTGRSVISFDCSAGLSKEIEVRRGRLTTVCVVVAGATSGLVPLDAPCVISSETTDTRGSSPDTAISSIRALSRRRRMDIPRSAFFRDVSCTTTCLRDKQGSLELGCCQSRTKSICVHAYARLTSPVAA